MKELEVLHQKVSALMEKFQAVKDENAKLKENLAEKDAALSEAHLQINILKPALDEAQSISGERTELKGQLDKAIGDVNKILDLLNED